MGKEKYSDLEVNKLVSKTADAVDFLTDDLLGKRVTFQMESKFDQPGALVEGVLTTYIPSNEKPEFVSLSSVTMRSSDGLELSRTPSMTVPIGNLMSVNGLEAEAEVPEDAESPDLEEGGALPGGGGGGLGADLGAEEFGEEEFGEEEFGEEGLGGEAEAPEAEATPTEEELFEGI